MEDRKYLEWHGHQWRVQVKVPLRLRRRLGTKLVVPLHTESLANARRLRRRIVEELKKKIARAGIEASYEDDPLDLRTEEALQWKAAIVADDDDANLNLRRRIGEIRRTEGREKADAFWRVVAGMATPISSLVATWLAERDIKPRQKLDYGRAVRKFHAFTLAIKLDGSIEAVDRRVAGRYVSEALVARGMHWKTANKDISALSGYWKWLLKRGYLEVNVWEKQSLPKVKPRREEDRAKRPFMDAEVAKLLRGIEEGLLRDAMLIAALSGLRTEEIAQLRVSDCDNGVFCMRIAKTAAGVRDVPIHDDLAALVKRRRAGKSRVDYLFDELKDPAPGSAVERGQAITKQFVTARRRLGVDERLEDARQARVDFHSFRRWFIAKARDALQNGATGFDHWTICEVVGHDKEAATLGMTMGRYAGQQTPEARRACVASVKLPLAATATAAATV